jgi:GMP synthase (glutamine-hydrolysing)
MTLRPLLCIRHEPVDTLGVALGAFEAEGLPLVVLDAWDPRASWPSLGEVAGLLVLGGAMNVDQVDEYPFLAQVRGLAADAVSTGLPVFGICLGAQILARALGAPVVRAPARQLGFSPIRPTDEGARDPLLSVFRSGDRQFHWNEDMCEVPSGGTLLATDDEGTPQAYRVGSNAWATLFHPEIDRSELDGWIEEAGPPLEPAWGRSAEALRAEADEQLPAHQARGRALFRRFASIVRLGAE